jgi:hypothetical protein
MLSLRTISLVSGIYDAVLGLAMLLAAGSLAVLFGIPAPRPAVLADTNGLFLLVIGAGYGLPWRDPVAWRPYLWLMGPLLKGGGALVFLRDVLLRDSPAAFALFALSDGALALWTLAALMRVPVHARQREEAGGRMKDGRDA